MQEKPVKIVGHCAFLFSSLFVGFVVLKACLRILRPACDDFTTTL